MLVRKIANIPCEVISPSLYRIITPGPPDENTETRLMVSKWLGVPLPSKIPEVWFVFDGGWWHIEGLAGWDEMATFRSAAAAAEQLTAWMTDILRTKNL